MSSSRIAVSVAALPLLLTVFASPANAAQRSFTATLTKVAGCSLTAPSGSSAIMIDDASGAVTGTLTISGFDMGAEVSVAGIHNKNAGDNLVGGFDGVNKSSPNATHSVTTTLNSIALPKILAGDGVIIVKSAASGCAAGAIRGDLVGEGAPAADAGADAAVSDGGSNGGGGSDSGTTGPTSDGGTAPSAAAEDGGCSYTGSRAPSAGFSAFGLVLAALAVLKRRRSR